MQRNLMIYMTMALMLFCWMMFFNYAAYAAELPGEYLDSGVPPAAGEGLAEDVAAVRQYLELLIYTILPFSFALFICWQLGRWFYCTFLEGVL